MYCLKTFFLNPQIIKSSVLCFIFFCHDKLNSFFKTSQLIFLFLFIFFFAFVCLHSNNRIPPEGGIRLAVGLRVNKTIKSLNVSCQKEIGSRRKTKREWQQRLKRGKVDNRLLGYILMATPEAHRHYLKYGARGEVRKVRVSA